MGVRWDRLVALKTRRGLEIPPEVERRALEALAESILQLTTKDAARDWGEAIGYGLYSAAVIRPDPDLAHEFRELCPDVALKLFVNRAGQAVEFQLRCVAGQALPRVQRTLAAGQRADGQGTVRGYLVLDYIPGPSLEEALETPALEHVGVRLVVFRSFLADLLIPLWSRGLRLWDFRPANLILDPETHRLTLIDTDSLRGAMLEMQKTPDCWNVRNRWEDLALGVAKGERMSGRFEQLAVQLARRAGEKTTAVKRRMQAALAESGLMDVLRRLGRSVGTEDRQEAEKRLTVLLTALS